MSGDGSLKLSRSCVIPAEELEWRFSASSGPGGQHANTSNTRAEVRFDVLASRALGPRQRARILERLGPLVRVVASDERSQARNRELALSRLGERLCTALKVERPRVGTKPSRGSVERRLASKRHRSTLKATRGASGTDD